IIAAFAILAAVWWAALEAGIMRRSERDFAVLPSILLWLVGSCAGVVSMMVGIVSYGKCAIALAAAAAAMIPALGWGGSPQNALRGVPMIFATLMVTMLAGEHYLGSLDLSLIGILSIAPIMIWLGAYLPRSWRPWRRALARTALVILPLATAVTLAGL